MSGILTEDKKKDIDDTVAVLMQLDKNSLLLVKNGAELLKARQEMESQEKESQEKTA